MLWEISVLNKLYKTNVFTRIKSRVSQQGKPLYVVSNDMKFSTVMTEMLEGDRVTSRSDTELVGKYLIEAEGLGARGVDHYSNLYLYDTIMELVLPIDQNVISKTNLCRSHFLTPAIGLRLYSASCTLP